MSKVIRINKESETLIKMYREVLEEEMGLERECLYTLWDYYQSDAHVIEAALKECIDNAIKKGIIKI